MNASAKKTYYFIVFSPIQILRKVFASNVTTVGLRFSHGTAYGFPMNRLTVSHGTAYDFAEFVGFQRSYNRLTVFPI